MVTVNTKDRPPFYAWILWILVFMLSLGALISGPMLFLAPDGRLMQWTVAQLQGTPFPDYLLPGVILFIFIGLFPLFTGIALIKRKNRALDKLNPFKQFYWAWSASIAVGIILEIWIITETALLGYISFLQPLMGVWGILILLFTLLPGTRAFYRLSP
jgi:hypothetical protein